MIVAGARFATRSAASTGLNPLSVHPRVIDLGELFLDDGDLRAYSLELWDDVQRGG